MDVYARRVLGDASAGARVVAGPYVRQACERHVANRVLGAHHPRGIWFSAEAADVAIGYYETVLHLPDALDEDGNPKPFLLEPALAFIIGSITGWMGADGYRLIREAYVEMGKGNAKTPLWAGLGLFGLMMDGETAPEIYAAAVTRDQSKIMHRDADRMVQASPELRDVVTRTVNNLAYGMGFFRPYSRDQGIKSGPRPHMALIDEVHEHPTPEVIIKLKAGFKFRKQPFAGYITNSGFDRTSICWQLRQHAERVLRGTVTDDRFFAYVCALDDGDDPLTDEACWPKANPLLDVTITREYLRRQVENAKNIPSELNTVLRLNFCVWTNQQIRAIDMAKWQACEPVPPDAALVGLPCYGALDLGQSDDFSAWARLWELEDGRIAVKMRFWIPQAALELYPSRPYDEWRRAGILTVTEGSQTDYDLVEETVQADCEAAGVREVAYDKRFAEQLAQHLLGAGITMINTPQGFQLNEAIRKKLELIATGKLCHGNDPILAWMAQNYVLRHGTKGEVRPDKEHAGEKIDGQVAVDMGLDRIVRRPIVPVPSYQLLVLGAGGTP